MSPRNRPLSASRANRPGRIVPGPSLPVASLLLLMLPLLLLPAAASALIDIDFEQAYFVDPDHGVRDFCIVRPDSVYHIFYIAYDEAYLNSSGKTLGHATSMDLRHWTIHAPALLAGQGWWDAQDVWAPEVVFDQNAGRWAMMYTGVDSLKVQRACLAWSDDLFTWWKDPANPIFEPDPETYQWDPAEEWSSFRDPCLFRSGGQWMMLNTAGMPSPQYPDSRIGVSHSAVSTDLVHWTGNGPAFVHDGADGTPIWHDLESNQYLEIDGIHHLFFSEYDEQGTSHIAADAFGAWTMADRSIFDYGIAPEIDSFDTGVFIYSRYVMTLQPAFGYFESVVRIDTLSFDGYDAPDVLRPHPLERDWAVLEGSIAAGNPTWRENPVQRGDPAIGSAGNSYFGSAEFYQGPMSLIGSPGSRLGDSATGRIRSHEHVLVGDFLDFLIGGGEYPATCTFSLLDATTEEILLSATGNGNDALEARRWNIRPFQGRTVVLEIIDQETGPMGYINLDEIREIVDPVTDVGTRPPMPLILHGARPNPFNPATTISFRLDEPGAIDLEIFDARGRRVHADAAGDLPVGEHARRWNGRDASGRPLPSGVYLYRLRMNGVPAAQGRITLVK